MPTQKTFTFNNYELDRTKKEIKFSYSIKSPNQSIDFTEKLTFPGANFDISRDILDKLLTSLLLILGISYWKLYCPKKIEIKNFRLTKQQAEFWNKVYTKGLGEFFYQNQIDFWGLVNFPYINPPLGNPFGHTGGVWEPRDRSLLMLGGGKDSLVSAELLKGENKDYAVFVVNDHPLQQEIIKELGVPAIIVKRDVDQKLLELNKQKDTYNGHVPVSAIYAFITLTAAALYDYRWVISSNEKSANYGNVKYLGEDVNHQWSKSLEFEKLFQEYVKKNITPSIFYFSLLRPLYELKIAQLFAAYPHYFSVFTSCNRKFRIKNKARVKWCKKCPKCAFIFAILSAFLPKKEVTKFFGKNLLADTALLDIYKQLLGIKAIKPFECIGTPDETRLALYLIFKKREFDSDIIIRMFKEEVLPTLTNIDQLENNLLSASNEHRIPKEFRSL